MGINLKTTTDTWSGNDYSWMANRKGWDTCRSITLDLTTFLAAHYSTGKIPSGTALGKITATGLYGPYDDTLADGTNVFAGFLLQDTLVTDSNGNALGNPGVALFWEGIVIESKLPAFAGTSKGEINANAKTDNPNIRYE